MSSKYTSQTPIYCSSLIFSPFPSPFPPIQALRVFLSLSLRDYIHMLSRDRWGQHPTYSRHSEALTLVRKLLRRLKPTHTQMRTHITSVIVSMQQAQTMHLEEEMGSCAFMPMLNSAS